MRPSQSLRGAYVCAKSFPIAGPLELLVPSSSFRVKAKAPALRSSTQAPTRANFILNSHQPTSTRPQIIKGASLPSAAMAAPRYQTSPCGCLQIVNICPRCCPVELRPRLQVVTSIYCPERKKLQESGEPFFFRVCHNAPQSELNSPSSRISHLQLSRLHLYLKSFWSRKQRDPGTLKKQAPRTAYRLTRPDSFQGRLGSRTTLPVLSHQPVRSAHRRHAHHSPRPVRRQPSGTHAPVPLGQRSDTSHGAIRLRRDISTDPRTSPELRGRHTRRRKSPADPGRPLR